MTRSTLFKNNQTQAVRLPKAVAFPDGVREVEIVVTGKSRVIAPIGHRWDDFFASGPHVSEDFMKERIQPPIKKREAF
jgi:antitoxin VapB